MFILPYGCTIWTLTSAWIKIYKGTSQESGVFSWTTSECYILGDQVTTTLVYRNTNSFNTKRRVRGLSRVTIYLFRTLMLSQEIWYGYNPGATAPSTNVQDDTSCLLGWLLFPTDESKSFRNYIIFWRLHILPSGANHVIHFRCPLFTLRHSCISSLRNQH